MGKVIEQIRNADDAIVKNIEALAKERALLSLNILSQLRNLLEGVVVYIHHGSTEFEFKYEAIGHALKHVREKAGTNFLAKFHRFLQKSASHFTLDGDASERLMLKYYEYLYRLRSFLREHYDLHILQNLESFPVDLDPSLREYHEKISARIDAVARGASGATIKARYYIHKKRPFFVQGRVYYEVTFYRAVNKVNKFDRCIAFTAIDIAEEYAATLVLQRDSIDVIGQAMPITIIRSWDVSIRPCEIENFARILGISARVRSNSAEYLHLMQWLTEQSASLLDLMDMSDGRYASIRSELAGARAQIFPALDSARRIIRAAAPGHNVLRYLMLRMNNQILKPQYYWRGCDRLSKLCLQYGCIPFDEMPLCTSLIGHNPRYWDLVHSLDFSGREHELLARRVQNNVERRGMLYTPVTELKAWGDVSKLISKYNSRLYYAHTERQLLLDKGHVFIKGYEKDTASIVRKLQAYSSSGIDGYSSAVERWLREAPRAIDDPSKRDALKLLFSQSRVALVYGAAGTGKSTMVDHIAHYFSDKEKLFLAHTNPAVDNLRRKVTAQNSHFRTISSQTHKVDEKMYDVLVIDECSTVSNADLLKVLEKTSFRLLVLVGDIYQIESIQFGNWFGMIRSFIPKSSVFELTTPFRTKKKSLLEFWSSVRSIDDDLAEIIARDGYSTVLNKSLFDSKGVDEIILCLNYDGLYGINNVNRFLQSGNPNPPVVWRESIFKIGDPVLFHEAERFRPVIYNNLKGRIVGIDHAPGWIGFDVELDRSLSEFDVMGDELEWVKGSIVRFRVYESDISDEDDDALNTTLPFQVAYAVSIHKAQGLEYDAVKIVITDANEEDITHNIFYTAVTRARESLKIFWTPETQHGVLQRLSRSSNGKDVALLSSRCKLQPVNA